MDTLLCAERGCAVLFFVLSGLFFVPSAYAQGGSGQSGEVTCDTIYLKEVSGIPRGSYVVISKSKIDGKEVKELKLCTAIGSTKHREVNLSKGIRMEETIYKDGSRDTIFKTSERSAMYQNKGNKLLFMESSQTIYKEVMEYLVSNFKELITVQRKSVESEFQNRKAKEDSNMNFDFLLY